MLDTAISGLQNGAEDYGVTLPEDYWFSFAAQKNAIQFDTNTLQTLATQLIDINALCEVLYDAKVVAIDSVRRMPVTDEDGGWQDYLPEESGETNMWAVVMPYEVTFKGYTPEMARVFEGLIRSRGAHFVVKNLGINRADAAPVQTVIGMPLKGRASRGDGGSPNPYSRYGDIASSQLRRHLRMHNIRGSILDENLLKVTLTVDSVRRKVGARLGS